MKLQDLHKDIERYLDEDCYCPNEIYSSDGVFFYQFPKDTECEKLGEALFPEDNEYYIICLAKPPYNDGDAQILYFHFDTKEDRCINATRYDATENNIKMFKIYCDKGPEEVRKLGMKFNEYEEGSTAKSLKELLDLSNGIVMYD